jgi:chromosome segregation protein
MFLSKLQILGFKSFPQKTELHFDRGITAIVGPNGCGKTNLLDAIRWVLGEQRTTLLRSSKMEEVIFSGTKDLKPLGMAEVTLTIENTSGILPTDYSQVVVARRLFRSGESEYLLNKTLCRLKDITELFLDTGVGIHAYSVIQPEMVEAILSERAEERRFLFEEAAGITKYKLRKKEAEKKLEYTENDLLRLNDILLEVEKQVNSLRRQKGRAERFKRLTDTIKDLEIKLSQHEFQILKEQEKELAEKLQMAAQDSQKVSTALEKEEAEIEDIKLKVLEKEKEALTLQKWIGELSERGFEVEREISVSRERRSNLERQVSKDKEEIENLTNRLSSVTSQREEKKNELNRLSLEIRSKKDECEKEEKVLLANDEKLEKTKEELEELSSDWQKLNDNLTLCKGEKENTKSRIEELKKRQTLFTEEAQAVQQRIDQISERLRILTATDEEKRRLWESKIEEAKLLKEKIEKNQEKLASLISKEGGNRTALEGGKARLEILRQISEHYEGYGQGEKSVLSAKKELTGIIDTVANLIDTDEKYLKAIESALGSSLQFIVCQNVESALQGIEYLKREKKGGATFLPLDKIEAFKINSQRIDLNNHPEAIGWASDLIECERKFEKLVDLLLAHVILVKTLDDGLKLSSQIETGFHLATLDGEIIRTEGALFGGSPREISLLGRELEIHKLEQRVAELNQRLNEVEVEKKEKEKEGQELQKLLSQRVIETEEFTKQIQQSEIELKTLEFEKTSLKKRQDELEILNQEIDQRISELNQKVETQSSSLLELEDKKEKVASLLEAKKQSQEQTEAFHNDTFRKANQLKIDLVSLQGKEEQIKNEDLRLSELITEIKNVLSAKENESKNSQAEIEKISKSITEKEKELKKTLEKVEEEKRRLSSIVEDQTQWQESLNLKEKDLKVSRGAKEKVLDQLHHQEMEKLELSSQAKNIKDKIREEYQIDLEQIEPFIPSEKENVESIGLRLSTLRDRLKSTGPVNLLALEEYQSAKQRFDFLQNQVKDLTEAKQTLTSTIAKINHTARELFTQTFEQIKSNFQKVFVELFEGGETELKLLESEDPLESPIQISARPFGKRLLNISQLSAGEKALTAIALLFAIYLIKPSPFCILDEVDAPLDDANITRFLKLIKHFTSNTQFILITHNKLTMEAADILYGVTMEQPGVSKIVSVKFEKHEMVTK